MVHHFKFGNCMLAGNSIKSFKKGGVMGEKNWTRFDDWSPLIPKRGETIQLQFEEGGEAFETDVLIRGVSRSKRTFTIFVRWPLEPDGVLGLTITPDASGVGMADRAAGMKPYWQTIPKNEREEPRNLKLFFCN